MPEITVTHIALLAGTLIIGVDDDHRLIGMDFDYESNWKGNKDGFTLDFRSTIETAIGINNYNKYVSVNYEMVEDKELIIRDK